MTIAPPPAYGVPLSRRRSSFRRYQPHFGGQKGVREDRQKIYERGNEKKNMSTSILESSWVSARTAKTEHRLARVATIVGTIASYSALALSSTQSYSVSSATLGPGAFLLTIPKHIEGALAPFVALAGAVGAACGLSALWLQRGEPKAARRPSLGAFLVVSAGLAGAAMSACYTRQVLAARGDFAAAFGADWQEHIPSHLKDRMLPQRWTWHLSVAPGVHVERDIPFATVPGTDRKLLADVWSAPLRAGLHLLARWRLFGVRQGWADGTLVPSPSGPGACGDGHCLPPDPRGHCTGNAG
jgi:hypothetical protein